MPHRPSTVRSRPGPRRRVAAAALATVAVLVAGALPAVAVDPPSPVVLTVDEGRDRTAGSAQICLDDWADAALYRWDSVNQTWVLAASLPERAPGCHVVELDLGTTQAEHAGRYRAVASPADLPTTGDDPGDLDVVVRLAPAVVATHPVDAVVTAGEDATFTAAAERPLTSRAPAPRAQWQTSPGGGQWDPVDGATGDTWTVTTSSALDGLLVRAVYTRTPSNAYQLAPEPVATRAAGLTAWSGVAVELEPQDVVATAGEEVTFDVGRVWGVAPVHLQWESAPPGGDFEPVPGATAASVTLTAGTGAAVDGARFRLCHGNDYSAWWCGGRVAQLTVLPAPAAPEVIADPVPVRALLGEDVAFAAEATGADTVRWERRAPGSETWAPIAGEATTRLEVTAADSLDGTEFRAVFGNGVGETASRGATLTLVRVPPVAVTVAPSTVLVAALPGW